MFRLKASTIVNRGAADVSAFLADAANEKGWQKDIVHLELKDGKAGAKGAAWERVQLLGGRNIKTLHTLTAHEPGKRVAFSSEGKVIRLTLEYRLSGAEKGTRVDASVEGEMLGFAALFESVAAETLEKELPAGLERLKGALGGAA